MTDGSIFSRTWPRPEGVRNSYLIKDEVRPDGYRRERQRPQLSDWLADTPRGTPARLSGHSSHGARPFGQIENLIRQYPDVRIGAIETFRVLEAYKAPNLVEVRTATRFRWGIII
ncbi:MAG: hypothetical protein ACLTTP_00520 [Alistipes ihumii]